MTDREVGGRRIRSFVRRDGRITAAQRQALDTLWPRYAVMDLAQLRDQPALFGRDGPRNLEIGCGDGSMLVALAKRHPSCDFLGCEVYRPGLGRLLHMLARQNLANVRLAAMDAEELIDSLPDHSLDEIYVFFPDPWPKRRQQKRRLIKPAFLAAAHRVLRLGGRLRLATDWPDYADAIASLTSEAIGFFNIAGEGLHAPRPRFRLITRFEARAARLGHAVFEFVLGSVSRSDMKSQRQHLVLTE